jgi:hypothetical protein
MRIQETNRILNESRINRNDAARHVEESGTMSRAWKMVSEKITGLFRKH